MSKKSPKHTYKFNPHTLRYEKVIISLRDRVRRISFNVLFGIVLGVIIVIVGMRFFESPRERALNREVARYRHQTRLMSDRLDRAERVLVDLEERDANLYRTIFESEPVSDSVRRSGLADDSIYASLMELGDGGLLRRTAQKVDELTKRVYVESMSLDEIYELAKNKNERMMSVPAILPISKTQCKVVSGYGIRFHPILKSHRLHSGIDMTARQGTPIYATGDARVEVAGRSPQGYGGYGNVVVLNHGYGFQTLYAHMSTIKVKVGQRVKRGEQVGTVGSTGMSTGSHLHYEVILNGKKVDPLYYFFNDLTPEEYDEVIEQAREENQCMGGGTENW